MKHMLKGASLIQYQHTASQGSPALSLIHAGIAALCIISLPAVSTMCQQTPWGNKHEQ